MGQNLLYSKEKRGIQMKTVFARVNGRGVCVDFTYDQLKEIATFENLVAVLIEHFGTDDVVFEGFGEF